MTATLYGMTMPSWASHVEDKLAPMPLLLVQVFVDTLDQDLVPGPEPLQGQLALVVVKQDMHHATSIRDP